MRRLLASMLLLLGLLATLPAAEQEPAPKPAPASPPPATGTITVTVLGAVPKPGKVTVPNGSTLPMAIGAAGGFTKTANSQNVSVMPAGNRKPHGTIFDVRAILKKTAKDVVLKDGDTIRVAHHPWAVAPGK